MECVCINCGEEFQKKTGGYKRYSVTSLTSPRTFGKVFPGKLSPRSFFKSKFICGKCRHELRQKTMDTPKKKKRTWSNRGSPGKTFLTPVAKSVRSSKPEESNISPKDKAVAYLHQFKYRLAFSTLIQESEAAKEAFLAVTEELIKHEMHESTKKDSIMRQPLTLENLGNFSWSTVVVEAEENTPTLLRCLASALPTPESLKSGFSKGQQGQKRELRRDEKQEYLDRRVGGLLSILHFTNRPKVDKFIQMALGVEMWRQGCPQKIFTTLNHMGVTQGANAVRGHVDSLAMEFDRKIKAWKRAIESDREVQTGRRRRRQLALDETVTMQAGYGLCWDNIQVLGHTKHQTSTSANPFVMLAMCFATQNRVSTIGLKEDDAQPASQLPTSAFLPSVTDHHRRVQRAAIIVERILVDIFPVLERDLGKSVVRHISHENSTKMKMQSEVVNLGVVDANPSSTDGTIAIMEYLCHYVPEGPDGPLPLLCNGDGLSVERMIHAKRGRSNAGQRLKGLKLLVESPQEFHKEMLLLQDTIDLLFHGNSLPARGTLCHLKDKFKHRSMKTEVKANVQHVWDLLQFSTEAYIALWVTKTYGMEDMRDTPAEYPTTGSQQEKKKWLKRVAREVVHHCEPKFPKEGMEVAAKVMRDPRRLRESVPLPGAEDPLGYCHCGTVQDSPMVLCCNYFCGPSWFHVSCLNTEPPHADEDWYCSPSCQQSEGYIYCKCHQKRPGRPMVQCFLKEECRKQEWYHLVCIGTECDELPEKWFCSEECALGAESDDHVLNYTRTLMWEGLVNMTRKDAVREGDGPAMISDWKMDLIPFWHNNHNKYFLICHLFLASIAGFVSERLRTDLLWNRTANLSGLPGKNIGLDLVNEFLNNEFKEMLKRSRGRYTDDQVLRCARMSGAFGKEIDRLFSGASLADVYHPQRQRTRSEKYKQDIAKFVKDYKKDALHEYLPGRHHQGFSNFSASSGVVSPRELGKKLHEECKKIDLWKRITDQEMRE